MKYFFITASMVGGGTERVISILANHFAKKGNDVTILMTANDTIDYELDNRICTKLITTNTGGSILKRLERIQKLRQIYKENLDAAFYSFGTETNLFAILAGLGERVNLILSERNDPNRCTYKLLRDVIYFFGNKFVFQTEQAKRYFSKRIQNRSAVIPNPIREDIGESYQGVRKKRVVAVGRLEPQKNQKLLLEAFQLFHNEYQEFYLDIYGQGPCLDELKRETEKLNIVENVHFKGFSKNILEEIQDASMYVLSSDYEGIPNSLLEAMAIGLPVISTNCPIGGPESVICNGINGILVETGNAAQLAESMCYYAKCPEKAAEFGEKATEIKETNKAERIASMWDAMKN